MAIDYSKYKMDYSKYKLPEEEGIDAPGILQGVTDFGTGIGTALGKTLFGTAQAGIKLTPLLSKEAKGKAVAGLEKAKQDLYVKPFEKNTKTGFGKLGTFTGDMSTFLAPTGAILKGQKVLSTALKAKGVPGILSRTAGRVIPEAGVNYGVEYARTGGDAKSAKSAAIFSGVASGALGLGGDLYRGAFSPNLKQATAKALGISGSQKAGFALKDIDRKIEGFQVLKEKAKQVVVRDIDGIEKVFNPKQATFGETLQAWEGTRDLIFKEYTDIAKQATKAGLEIDLKPLADDLLSINNAKVTSNTRRAALGAYNDLVRNFSQVGDDGIRRFNATPEDLEVYLKDLNETAGGIFQGTSDKATAKVAATTSSAIRNLMDSLIEKNTGQQYQVARNKYAALKAIEKDLVKRFKQEARQIGGGLTDYVDIFNSGDIIAGAFFANPGLIASGVTRGVIGRTLKGLKDPNRYLRMVFSQLDNVEEPALRTRIFGSKNPYNESSKSLINKPTTTPPTINKNVIPKAISKTTPKVNTIKKVQGEIPPTKKGLIQRIKETPGKQSGMIQAYKGEKDLTTKILKDLEGKTTVSKQYILDATNRGELKQVERDLVRNILEGEKDVVNVKDFAKKVKAELLPLEIKSPNYPKTDTARYENITLPRETRGNVKNYTEHIYNSPIKTSAGDVHFSGSRLSDNYFGHTRIEDMADNKTRRVIEVQSDLYQKGNLEKEIQYSNRQKTVESIKNDISKAESRIEKLKKGGYDAMARDEERSLKNLKSSLEWAQGRLDEETVKLKLQQYNDPTAHFRMIREEIKKAAQDGKTKLQFPTGETAMKIEGLGERTMWNTELPNGNRVTLKPEMMKTGMEVFGNNGNGYSDWIITDVLGDGKFKAVPKNFADKLKEFDQASRMRIERGIDTPEASARLREQLAPREETFDISGKVDTNNPIYKFYEKDVQKYLNKFGGKRVVDDKGVSWIEVPITKEQGKQAVEAFGKIATSPLYIGAGLSAWGVILSNKLKKKDGQK